MDVFERNELRLAALAKVDPEARRKYRLGRLLEVHGDSPETATYVLNFSVSPDEDMPWIRERPVPVKNKDKDLAAVLNGEGLRLLGLPGLRALPITGLDVHRAFSREGNPAAIRAFFKRPELEGIRWLDMRGVKIGAASAAIATSKSLGALTWLDIGGDAKLAPLLDAKNLGGLRHLGFSSTDASTAGLLAVLESPGLAGLRSLDFSSMGVTDGGIDAVAAAPELARIESLEMACGLTGKGWRTLMESPHIGGLRRLDTEGGTVPTDESAAIFLSNPRPAHLEELSVTVLEQEMPAIRLPALRRLHIRIDHASAVRQLAADPALGRLDHLTIRLPWTAMDALGDLYASPGLARLASLAVLPTQGVRNDDDLTALARLPRFERLRRLAVGGPTKVLVESGALRGVEVLTHGVDDMPALAASADAASLKELRLGGARLAEDAVKVLTHSPHLANLQLLDASETYLKDPVLAELTTASNFQRLVRLKAQGFQHASPELIQRLALHANMPKLWELSGVSKVAERDPETRYNPPSLDPTGRSMGAFVAKT